MPRWNGARNDLHGSALSPSQTIRPLVRSPFGKIDELALLDAQNPDVAARRDDDPLHQPEPAAEGDAFGRRQRLAGLVEDGDRLAAVAGEPGVVVGVDRRAEGASLHAAAGEARGDRRERAAVRRELGGVTLPQRVRRLPADGEVIADPEVALAVEHRLAARAIAAAVEFERQHPGARRGVEIGHEWNRAQVLARRDRIEKVEQRKEPVRADTRDSARWPRPPSACRSARRPSAAWPPGKAFRRRSGVTRVAQPASASASVAKFAIVGVWPLLSGS